MNTRNVTLTTVFAAAYTGLGYALHPISFLAIQVRIACALIPLISLFGNPALYGLIIGHAILNASSPLGWLDMLAVPLFIPAKIVIRRFGIKAVPLHVLSVAVYVGWMLHTIYALPLTPTIVSVGLGEAIAEIGLGVPLYYAIQKRLNQ